MKVELQVSGLVAALRRMKKREREAFIEDLLAATSPSYLAGIREARADYKAGRVKSHAEVFPQSR